MIRTVFGTALMWCGLLVFPLTYIVLKLCGVAGMNDGIWGWTICLCLFIAVIGKIIKGRR